MESELLDSGTLYYYDKKLTNNIFLKLTYQGDTSSSTTAQKSDKNETRSCWKHLGREHLSLDMFMNALLLSKEDDKIAGRVN